MYYGKGREAGPGISLSANIFNVQTSYVYNKNNSLRFTATIILGLVVGEQTIKRLHCEWLILWGDW